MQRGLAREVEEVARTRTRAPRELQSARRAGDAGGAGPSTSDEMPGSRGPPAAADAALAKEKALTEDYAGEVALGWASRDPRGQLGRGARARTRRATSGGACALGREAELRADGPAAARAGAGDLREAGACAPAAAAAGGGDA